MNKRNLAMFAALAALTICPAAKAGTVFSIQPASVFGNPGDAADVFDVVLTNTGSGSLTIGAFSFEVSVTDPDLSLNAASFTTTAAPYIFAGNSFDQNNGLTLSFTSGLTLDASDSDNTALSGVLLASGASLALGEVSFSIAQPATLGAFAVTFTGGLANSLSDAGGNNVSVDTETPGTINVVPEPSAVGLTLAGAALLAALRKKR